MSWTQFRERNVLMARIIERAAADPDAALEFDDDELGQVQRLFGDEDTLLLALRQRWMTTLNAKLDQATYDGKSVERAHAELAKAQPGLRAVVDAAARRSVRMRALQHGEQQMVDYFNGPNHPKRRDVVA
jgi:ATP adenylyltransferase